MSALLLPDPDEVRAFADRRERVLARIAAACAHAGRDPGSVELVAVSKTVPAERLVSAIAAGLTTLGENRVQEGAAKRPFVPGARWVLVGPLQANKARRAIETFDAIQTIDSLELARRLDRIVREVRGPEAPAYPVLLQVNVDRDPAKAGFEVGEVAAALEAIAGECGALRLDGLMTIGRLVETEAEARATFRGLRELSGALRAAGLPIGPELSMGMSEDYPLAVEEGATIVRVGRALFGERAAEIGRAHV